MLDWNCKKFFTFAHEAMFQFKMLNFIKITFGIRFNTTRISFDFFDFIGRFGGGRHRHWCCCWWFCCLWRCGQTIWIVYCFIRLNRCLLIVGNNWYCRRGWSRWFLCILRWTRCHGCCWQWSGCCHDCRTILHFMRMLWSCCVWIWLRCEWRMEIQIKCIEWNAQNGFQCNVSPRMLTKTSLN